MYTGHFRDDPEGSEYRFQLGDIAQVTGAEIPDVELAWASFPCTDLSLAGNRHGLAGQESGTFWQFTRVLEEMGARRPPVVALENVVGLTTSHGGKDLFAAVEGLNELGYSVDVLTLDARRFVPQSRPRLFVVAAQQPPEDVAGANPELRPAWLRVPYDNPALRMHRALLPQAPAVLSGGLESILEDLAETNSHWWEPERTRAFLDSLSALQAARLEQLRSSTSISHRTAYRRTRQGVARWEIRPDDIAGCLRTARGGSSKQALVRTGQGKVLARWMTAREYARLMGVWDYNLEGLRRNQALCGFGDAVVVPVVAWLAEHYIAPLVERSRESQGTERQAVVAHV
jgi:DNA (cytosine-5)-methyltransferase 1